MKRVNIERVLCPIDFSEFSRDALDHAVAMASWYRATLTVMHVIDMPQAPLGGLPAGSEAFAPVFDRGKVAEDIRAFAEPAIGSVDVRWDVVAAFGPAAMAIQLHAAHIHADLVVVGTHGRSGFQRFLLGSVTEKLLRGMAAPLLIVPPPVKKPETITYGTVLCPLDFSNESIRALDYALSLAQESGARIILLQAVETLLDDVDPLYVPNMNVPEYLHDAEQKAMARLKAAVPDEARVWADPVERVVRGRAYRQILTIADQENAGLIVMGVRGKGALDRLLFGSTTEHVIREARCPVLTLHSEDR
jgi:nucleotide-binding universal stress UspA family protein